VIEANYEELLSYGPLQVLTAMVEIGSGAPAEAGPTVGTGTGLRVRAELAATAD
jgi:hypothetical protein